MRQLVKIAIPLVLSALLAACGTDSSSGNGSSGSASSTPVTVTGSSTINNPSGFTLRLTDAPVDAMSEVFILVREVELKRTSGGWIKFTLDTPAEINLLSLQGTSTANLLENVEAEDGNYKEIRLIVDGASMSNRVTLKSNGMSYNLNIPSGASSGIKIKGDFMLSTMQPTTMVADFDLRQSLRQNGNSNNYTLNPVVRLVDLNDVGHIRGLVNQAMLTAPSCSDNDVDSYNAVYVYDGHNAVTDDINQQSGNNNDPMATSSVVYNAAAGGYLYEAAFLPQGDYTIAFTCNSDSEDLDADDNLQFFDIQNVTVVANNTLFL